MNYEVYLRTRRLDLEPPFFFFVALDVGVVLLFRAADADAADAATGAATRDAADAATGAATGAATRDDETGAATRDAATGAADAATTDAFASFLRAVACLASSFFRSRLASSATFLAAASFTRVASATSAACFFVRSASWDSAILSVNNLTNAGGPLTMCRIGHMKLRRSGAACRT